MPASRGFGDGRLGLTASSRGKWGPCRGDAGPPLVGTLAKVRAGCVVNWPQLHRFPPHYIILLVWVLGAPPVSSEPGRQQRVCGPSEQVMGFSGEGGLGLGAQGRRSQQQLSLHELCWAPVASRGQVICDKAAPTKPV